MHTARNQTVRHHSVRDRNIQNQIAQNRDTQPSNQGQIGELRERTLTELPEARMERITAYQASALNKDHDLEANLGSIAAGLMRIAVRVDEALERSMTAGTVTVERLQRLLPAIEVHLRVTRQIDRFAHLEQQIAQSRQSKKQPSLPGKPSGASAVSEELRS